MRTGATIVDSAKAKSNLAKAPLVYIEWIDAVADCEWQEDVKAEVHLCRTIGWVVAESTEAICVACTVSMESSNARMHIPKAWIRNKKEMSIETIISESKGKSKESKPVQNTNRRSR